MPSTRSLTRWIAVLGAVTVAACSSPPGVGPSAEPASPPSATAEPSPTAAPTASAGDAWLIVGTAGEPTLQVILDSTLENLVELPVGAPDDTWGHILTATPRERTTMIENLVVQPGFGGSRQEIDGRWELPTVGLDPIPLGISTDRSTIVLVDADARHGAAGIDREISRFAVVDGSIGLARPPRVIELAGAFDFDALSPDGKLLYVAEQVSGPLEARYQVRVVETATGRMRDAVIVDKRNVDEVMAGWPVDQERRADGMVMTLYRGADYPFVHALSSIDAWAVCIDLPTRGFDDVEAAADWGIVTLGADKGSVAVNATLGIAVDIHPTDLTVRRTVDFEPAAASPFRLAKFGHADLGPAGLRVVAAPDGDSLFAAGAGGIVRLGATDLDVRQRYLPGTAIDGLAITPDGATLFALTRSGRIARLDALSGEIEGWVGEGGFDRLLGAVPW